MFQFSAMACAVYEPSLLGEQAAATASNGSAGSSAAGTAGSEQGDSGGSANGGTGSGTSGIGSSTAAGSGGGGVAGMTGSGAGVGGAGGSNEPPVGGHGGAGSLLTIDDMEDGNAIFFVGAEGRGRWYLSNDGTSGGEQTPGIEQLMAQIPDGRGTSERAVHTAASGFTGWGASVGFTFENATAERAPYDASAYAGVSFFAKVGSSSATSVRVAFPDMNTDPIGGVCGNAETETGDCLDHFGKTLELTTEWAPYVLEFDKLGQKGWGHLVPSLDESALLGMEISWGNVSMEIWVDDVEFVP